MSKQIYRPGNPWTCMVGTLLMFLVTMTTSADNGESRSAAGVRVAPGSLAYAAPAAAEGSRRTLLLRGTVQDVSKAVGEIRTSSFRGPDGDVLRAVTIDLVSPDVDLDNPPSPERLLAQTKPKALARIAIQERDAILRLSKDPTDEAALANLAGSEHLRKRLLETPVQVRLFVSLSKRGPIPPGHYTGEVVLVHAGLRIPVTLNMETKTSGGIQIGKARVRAIEKPDANWELEVPISAVADDEDWQLWVSITDLVGPDGSRVHKRDIEMKLVSKPNFVNLEGRRLIAFGRDEGGRFEDILILRSFIPITLTAGSYHGQLQIELR